RSPPLLVAADIDLDSARSESPEHRAHGHQPPLAAVPWYPDLDARTLPRATDVLRDRFECVRSEHEGDDERREIPVGSDRDEQALRKAHVERLLDVEGELDEIERVDGESIDERDRRRELFDTEAQPLGNELAEPSLQLRGVRVRVTAAVRCDL